MIFVVLQLAAALAALACVRAGLRRPLLFALPFGAAGAYALGAVYRVPGWLAGEHDLVGAAAWGALAGMTGAFAWQARRRGDPVPEALDRLAPALGVWLGVSRLGCFAAGCDAGRVTDAAWAMRFGPHTSTFRDHAARGLVLPTDAASLAVHPAQLYEATAAFAIAFAAHRLRLAPGRTALVAAASYALARAVIELFRDDPAPALGTSLAVLLGCIALFSGARLASARPAA